MPSQKTRLEQIQEITLMLQKLEQDLGLIPPKRKQSETMPTLSPSKYFNEVASPDSPTLKHLAGIHRAAHRYDNVEEDQTDSEEIYGPCNI